VLALLGLLAYGLAQKSQSQTIDSQLRAGKRPAAPAISLPELGTGKSVALASMRGKVVVLNFWASWCDPCKGEAPVLERWQKKMQPQRGTVVGVDVLDVTGDAQGFVKQYGLSYPQLRDADGSELKRFDVLGYPETVVLDRQGRIAATARGPVDDRFFTAQVVPLLKEKT
jgi:cytochrome c biogenesis protein CcmG/thiol:disulfide interchange protein DsbE